MHVDRPFFNKDMIAPHFIKQLGPRVDTFRMRHKKEKQSKLGWPKIDRLSAGYHTMRRRIQGEIAHLNRLAG